MTFLERKVLELLLEKAAEQGYYPGKIEALNVGEDNIVTQDRMQLQVIREHVAAWDANSEITFYHGEDDASFWVQLVWGNGESLIHDYPVFTDAERIVVAVEQEVDHA